MGSLNKTQKLLCYLIEKYGLNDDKVKLAKFQYFIDFIHYAFNDTPVSEPSIIYDKQKFGPLSTSFNADIDVLVNEGFIEEAPKFHFKLKKGCEYIFSDKEKKTIDYVWNKYQNLTFKELSDISHRQLPYQTAQMGGIVHLFTAYNLVDEYQDYEQL